MRHRFALLLSLLLFCLQSFGQSKAQKIDRLISDYYANGLFNGSVLVADHDKVILEKGFGYANFEWRIPNTVETKFRIGSITKTFTDLLVFQQIENGKLKLDGVVSDYLPDYPKPQGQQITIYHLMTHTSGLPDYDNMDLQYPLFYSHEKILAMFDSLPLKFQPGTKFSYSNSGAFLLGVILEKLTGKTYEQLLNENILQPLGLKNTGYDHNEYVIEKKASGYKVSGPQPLHDAYTDMSIPFSAYGLYSTCEDLYKWSNALSTNKLISKKSTTTYFKPFHENWACDWVVMRNPFGLATDSTIMQVRGGSISGFVGFVARIVNDRHCIVLLSNTASSVMEEMIQKITAILYDKPYSAPKKSLQKKLTQLINQGGLAIAVNEVQKLSKDTANYYLNAMEFLKMVGVYDHELNDPVSAIEVLKLMTQFYPGNFNPYGENSPMKVSFNVYGLLGNTYLETGQREKAIESFKKALELNPKDNDAVNALKNLGAK